MRSAVQVWNPRPDPGYSAEARTSYGVGYSDAFHGFPAARFTNEKGPYDAGYGHAIEDQKDEFND